MSRDIEKDMMMLRDSVNSGMIDDRLSGIVGEVRAGVKATSRIELADDELVNIAAAGDLSGRDLSEDQFPEWWSSIQIRMDSSEAPWKLNLDDPEDD